MSGWIRQVHRWTSAVFAVIVAAIFAAQGIGTAVADWVYFLPLAPLLVLFLTGAWMFVGPYLRRRPA